MISRRGFLAAAAALPLNAQAEPVIDIHQHTNYSGRTDEELVRHQRAMGIARTVLLPAGSKYGLAAGCGGNDTVVALARRLPKEYVYFANELPDIPETRPVIERFLKGGAIGIGEQKFPVEADSASIAGIAKLAEEYGVPVLLHFEFGHYNFHLENFHRVLDKYPRVNFIGHAQTWWCNIDRACDQKTMYPAGAVEPGGISDRLLADYGNMYGDLSAHSGLNSMLRDDGHAREFLKRHQDKLLYGSDCNDKDGGGATCDGGKILAAVRRLALDKAIERKILYGNAARLMKITA
jgi:uncharacterized protein